MPLNIFKISVIIPTYNRSFQILRSVSSVLNQIEVLCEVIVVDDGSSDDTEKVLAQVSDRIRYIKTKNYGVSAARNRGILEAQGDWIAFLDSDDVWHLDKIKRQIECIKRTGAKVCFCVSTDENGKPIDDFSKIDPSLEKDSEKFYVPGDCRLFMSPRHPYIQSMIVKKCILMKSGVFDESLWVAEDTKLIYELVLRFGYAIVNKPLVCINRNRDVKGLSDITNLRGASERYQCYTRVQAEIYWRLIPLDFSAAKHVKKNMLYFVSRQAEIACALGQKKLAIKYANSGLNFAAGWSNLVRNLLILIVHQGAKMFFLKKWNVKIGHVSNDSDVS